MHRLTVCVPTYKRPLMLRNLIVSITNSDLDKSIIDKVNIIIVDNDIDKTAENVVFELMETGYENFNIFYYNLPSKGLSNVRNELLNKAILQNPDFIIFIDDDEYVTLEWLNELVKTIVSNKADLVRGPVVRVRDDTIPEFISYWLKKVTYPNNMQIYSVVTDNLIINSKSLSYFNVWFDPRFNNTGSEDTYFGIQMMKKGATIYWAANAIVYETITENRATITWLIQRRFRGALMFTYMLRLEKKYFKILKKFMVSLAYIIAGICAMTILLIPIRKKFWGILKLFEGIGGLAGLFKVRDKEYY